mmetsp:Transcript_27235/g.63255  ORF Transcript_27235/g.63255 Transcript_27235/m.63255 type:complete len:100 (+) Transcript_27235:222-521(+)
MVHNHFVATVPSSPYSAFLLQQCSCTRANHHHLAIETGVEDVPGIRVLVLISDESRDTTKDNSTSIIVDLLRALPVRCVSENRAQIGVDPVRNFLQTQQ